ncbi:polysaccharide biosynthesis tyrosine autokinase [Microbacterium sp. P26]|uniref:polysaccharide biosynthesis tyrosine autokinase n=1 Tax=Microbacterium TaxID=33882 RepID=UPI00203DE8C4|nr:polysaccharide biosynthesis tyrosine autokinase [Microbacterium sp. P26]MCM3501410.1 polysaccharide biosynthesis tyrosine autokinase [Microbacterium sp. P26]
MLLRDVLAAIRRGWLLVVACMAIGAAAGTALAVLTPTTYKASVELYVAAETNGTPNGLIQGRSYVRQSLESFVDLVSSAVVVDPVIAQLGLSGNDDNVESRISAENPPSTQTIVITATDAVPSEASQLANAVAESFTTVVEKQLQAPRGTEGVGLLRVETVSPARVPLEPSAPDYRLNLLLGLALGAGAGIILAIIRTIIDTRIHTAASVESILSAPILGGIPFDPDASKRPLIVQESPRDPRSEAFRRARTALQFVNLDGRAPVYVVTSANPGEGKSTTSANLALALAEDGSSVALVDADMRKPRTAQIFGIEGGAGLSTVLAGAAPLSALLQPYGSGRLFVLPAGAQPPNPAELVGSPTMEATLDTLRQAFDYVIVDCPPVLPVTDAAVLARFATGAILVAASGSTRKPQLADAAKALAAADVRLLGVILTKLPTRGPDTYGYGAYTYGMTHQPTDA